MERNLADGAIVTRLFLMNHWSIWRPDDDDLEEAEIDVEVAAIEDEIDVQGDEILEDTDLGEVENDEEEDEDLDAELVATLEPSWVPSKGLNKKIQSYIESEMDNVVDMMNWIRNLSTSAEVYTQVSNTPRPRNNTVDSYLADFGSKVHYPFFLPWSTIVHSEKILWKWKKEMKISEL